MLLCEGVFADPVSTEKAEKKSGMLEKTVLFSQSYRVKIR